MCEKTSVQQSIYLSIFYNITSYYLMPLIKKNINIAQVYFKNSQIH